MYRQRETSRQKQIQGGLMTLPGKCTRSFPVSSFWVRRRRPPEEPIINSTLQNITTIIYIKLLTYCCSNLICLTSAVQLRGIDSCRHHKGAQSSLPHGSFFHTIVLEKMTLWSPYSYLLPTFPKQETLTLRFVCTYTIISRCVFSICDITMEMLTYCGYAQKQKLKKHPLKPSVCGLYSSLWKPSWLWVKWLSWFRIYHYILTWEQPQLIPSSN